jgi:hypothetical protein
MNNLKICYMFRHFLLILWVKSFYFSKLSAYYKVLSSDKSFFSQWRSKRRNMWQVFSKQYKYSFVQVYLVGKIKDEIAI